ncbi:two-component response regulator ARR11-like [Primulina eburnea]|uniref:two-component response regulator ARR11-like n=1 Tax=Primulina eburnea TaxID=1245227 RepID=UPI003C6C93ED
MVIEVHVLLVGNDVVSLLETSKLLEFNSYKVTAVSMAAIASSMLAKEKVKYDVVMVDVSPSDVQGFQLAHDAIEMGYTVILMSENPNMALMKCSIEDGAFMFIQKPATMEVLKYLWQHVLRENARKTKEIARFRETISTTQSSNFISNGGGNMIHPNRIEANINVQGLGSRNMVYRNGWLEDGTGGDRSKKPKSCTGWNQELHEKFVKAVEELGEGS